MAFTQLNRASSMDATNLALARACPLSNQEERLTLPGERVFAYENATTPTIPQSMGFKVIKRSGSLSAGHSLADCPNEILTQILSHLHLDSHGSVALVSKRFYALVTEPHAWRMAFLRYFPGQEAMETSHRKLGQQSADKEDPNRVRSEFRYFNRLTSLASWRSEYLLRTRLLRSVARGKPGASTGGIGASPRSGRSAKKASAVLTYNTKLPWMISNVHAVFTNARKGPRVIVGTAALCVSTVSDPSSGKVEKWGLDDPFAFSQLDELFPNLELYGLQDGPAAVPNVMDVSQPYGMVGGEGFPGGRPYYRATNELRGRYLGDQDSSIIDMSPEVPKIPEILESICSVWIAKSSTVPTMTQNMIGIMTGSSLGVVTTYAIGHDASGPHYKAGEMTARWVLSPGVPIIALEVDESYNQKRKSLGRVWACALNALGECFILTETPIPPTEASRKSLDSTKGAWVAGRSVYWELIESTRRQARPDEFDKNAVRGAYSPRSHCDSMGLSKDQIVAEAREIEKFFRYEPAHFRKVCDGWDMRRQLKVDFAEENILVIQQGCGKEQPPKILRYMKQSVEENDPINSVIPSIISPAPRRSIFGSGSQTPATAASAPPQTPSVAGDGTNSPSPVTGDWRTSELSTKKLGKAEITAIAMDDSVYALLAPFEDPLNSDTQYSKNGLMTPTTKQNTGEIPGRRARMLAVGTDHGKIFAWNFRDTSSDLVDPIYVVQTESPEITSLAISALYLVHGGDDGLVQAWDPLASSSEPIRTLSSRSSGRAPRHILNANPALRHADYATCPAIFLDPDPTVLRGILCFGTFVRFWTYGSTTPTIGRKRRMRNTDIHGRLASRRQGDAVLGYIAAEEDELRREQEHFAREDARLRNRFGVGLGDLTEEEAIRYAQMISEEAFLFEQRRTSASDTGSAADIGETNSSTGSLNTITPDPSLSERGPSTATPPVVGSNSSTAADDDYEQQIQQALRLSLMESVNDVGQSPWANSSTDFEFHVKYKPQKGKGSSPTTWNSNEIHTPLSQSGGASDQPWGTSPSQDMGEDIDEDLAMALRLSLEEEEQRKQALDVGLGIEAEGFPPLDTKGKGKEVARY
ncbi:F-box/WD repeat-containing protein pof10 [Cytospora mali]|uniref:F-box/WD repeat-containing protein pof10 n=1 Tax=Cytospora mali TaxID=578113 RepID=A0A194UT57_CYTMA|nr:F-box/WD repeat-containing protein pof10 [Valsa mali var. pyri (nom. inval.)]